MFLLGIIRLIQYLLGARCLAADHSLKRKKPETLAALKKRKVRKWVHGDF